MNPDTETPQESGNAFERLIRQHRKGLVAEMASEKLVECVETARDRGSMSTLTIKMKFKPQNDDQILIDAEVTNTLPKEQIPSGMMYADDDNILHTSDPRQQELPLREVESPSNLREAPAPKDVQSA